MQRMLRAAAIAGSVVLLATAPALADPPGNNGTVKIDGVAFDIHPDNEPHVGCVFQVDFYGFDEGVGDATATFRLHPPTGRGVLLVDTADNDQDPAGGGTDLDFELDVDLSAPIIASGVAPHPIQGWHVKLTVNAPGSIGADVKHKVFWVRNCDIYPPVPVSASLISGVGELAGEESNGVPVTLLALIALTLMAAGFVVSRRMIARAAATHD